MKEKKPRLEISLREHLTDDDYKKIRAFEREMNAKNYTKHHRKKK